jgi:hypothetical protein
VRGRRWTDEAVLVALADARVELDLRDGSQRHLVDVPVSEGMRCNERRLRSAGTVLEVIDEVSLSIGPAGIARGGACTVEVPVAKVTACCFTRYRLFVTSGRRRPVRARPFSGPPARRLGAARP